jgi:hypothetical protein
MVLQLTGCSGELPKADADVFDAIAFLSFGLYEGRDSGATIDRRTVTSKSVIFSTIAEKYVHPAQGEQSERALQRIFQKTEITITSPRTCTFALNVTQASSSGSKGEFGVSDNAYLLTLNLKTLTRFSLEIAPNGAGIVVLEGKQVRCMNDICVDKTSLHGPRSVDPRNAPSIQRHAQKAIDLIKAACPT